MTNRIIDLSNRPAHLSAQNSLLVIRFREACPAPTPNGDPEPPREETYRCEQLEKANELTTPFGDIACLIVSHPQISLTHAVLSGLAESGGIFVTCNQKHLPVSMLLPLATHHLQAERFSAQAALSLPAKKRLWQQVVRAKLRAQNQLLLERTGKDHYLEALASRVRSGDPSNIEAQAARLYWPLIFASKRFHRDPDGDGLNARLNYGYAVLRAITARAICGAGLHPCLGIHHRNRYDAFCLADDLMEPFRPIVDREVAKTADTRSPGDALDKQIKGALVAPLTGRFTDGNESRTLFDWIARAACSLASLMEGACDRLELPDLKPESTPS